MDVSLLRVFALLLFRHIIEVQEINTKRRDFPNSRKKEKVLVDDRDQLLKKYRIKQVLITR